MHFIYIGCLVLKWATEHTGLYCHVLAKNGFGFGQGSTDWSWKPLTEACSHWMGLADFGWDWQRLTGMSSHCLGLAATDWYWQPLLMLAATGLGWEYLLGQAGRQAGWNLFRISY